MQNTFLIHHFLENSCEKSPEKEAVFHKEKWYTYDYINRKSNQLAHLFLETGIKKGDRIALLVENSIEYVVSYYAILKVGGISVEINIQNIKDDLEYIFKNCQSHLLVTKSKYLNKVDAINRVEDVLKCIFLWSENKKQCKNIPDESILYLPELLNSYPSVNPGKNFIDQEIASIVYTSGSTGKPRGVTLSHLNVISNTRSIVEYLKLTSKDRIMVVLPFFYIYGKSLLNTHFFVNGSVVIDNRFLYPNVVLKTMADQKVTGFSGVPSNFTILLYKSDLKSYRFKSLRYVTQAGGALAASAQKEVADLFSPAHLYIMYGATEASARLSYLDPKDLPRKWGSIGKAIPNVDLYVADAHGNPLNIGEKGEIVARGANIMKGYWNDPEETAKVLKNGLYYTGDIGRMDEEGFLYVVGRSKEIIKVGGNRVSAKEIEEVFYEHPNILEVGIIGIEDDILGEAIKAFVVLKNTSNSKKNKQDIIEFLNKKRAPYKIPKYIEYRDSLPKNLSGKLEKLKLH
jgi:acyl-CoA synthetase (AMP-forming)/AMP-acid ligase II